MVASGRRPDCRREIVRPAFCSGLIWGLADICWFVANDCLSFTVSFPIVTSGPGFVSKAARNARNRFKRDARIGDRSQVAALWGIFVFGEVQGRDNILRLFYSFVILCVAVSLIVVSH